MIARCEHRQHLQMVHDEIFFYVFNTGSTGVTKWIGLMGILPVFQPPKLWVPLHLVLTCFGDRAGRAGQD